ncbi:hypothetical protein Shyhy02_52870 [Streptomyces hygroscopicus subsp. hygroscopicus]|nr:hypothetical protein Shyhy02_52870 [Streptomyces hygroscopicus subsp. hygroscopicus]
MVRTLARRRKALVAELLGHFGNAASVRATLREPRSQLRTAPQGPPAAGVGQGRTLLTTSAVAASPSEIVGATLLLAR